MGSPKSLHEDVYGHTPIYINIRCSISYYKKNSIMYCPFECIYVCFSLRSDDFFLCTIFVADWMIQSWFNVSSLSCSILGISIQPLLTSKRMTNKPLTPRHELRVFKIPQDGASETKPSDCSYSGSWLASFQICFLAMQVGHQPGNHSYC